MSPLPPLRWLPIGEFEANSYVAIDFSELALPSACAYGDVCHAE